MKEEREGPLAPPDEALLARDMRGEVAYGFEPLLENPGLVEYNDRDVIVDLEDEDGGKNESWETGTRWTIDGLLWSKVEDLLELGSSSAGICCP